METITANTHHNFKNQVKVLIAAVTAACIAVPLGYYYSHRAGNVKDNTISTPSSSVTMEEKYILLLSPKTKNAQELGSHIKFTAETFGVDSKLLIAIAFQESSFRTDIISNNDLGLFQLNYGYQIVGKNRPYTIEEIVTDWKLNSILAAQHLRECMAVKRDPKTKLESWTCYHSFTYEKALVYQYHVNRHLRKLEQLEKKK